MKHGTIHVYQWLEGRRELSSPCGDFCLVCVLTRVTKFQITL